MKINRTFGTDTLLIIPCCASKIAGGVHLETYNDPLSEFVTPSAYSLMSTARIRVLTSVKNGGKFLTGKYQKNISIQNGADFGGNDSSGSYLSALNRYVGTLYTVPEFKQIVSHTVVLPNSPKIMILSALYGPLHPESQIQDYNLMMGDKPAAIWSDAFPSFLEDYVRKSSIKQIVLYVGTSTAYFRIAKKAVLALREKFLIELAIQYHVENGNTRETPLQHGLRLLDDIDFQSAISVRCNWERIVENIL